MRNVSDKIVRKIKTHIIFNKFFRKSCRLWDGVEKYSRVGQAMDDDTTRRICITCWV